MLDCLPMNTSAPTDALTRAVRAVLRPIVRLMLARGITLPMAVELLKRSFVEVAVEQAGAGRATVTDSRVSVLTGLHRKDIRRLRELPHPDGGLPQALSLGSQLVSVWTTCAEWLDGDGWPLALPRLSSRGGERSFEALVASVSKDVRARAVLEELLRLGVARLSDADEVVLNSGAFVPTDGLDEKLAYLALNVGAHAEAAVDNTLGRPDPWFERSVHFPQLSDDAIALLRAQAAELAMHTLQTLNVEGQRATRTDAQMSRETQRRFTFGIYLHAESALPPEA